MTQVRKEHMTVKECVHKQLKGKSIIFLETATFKILKSISSIIVSDLELSAAPCRCALWIIDHYYKLSFNSIVRRVVI